MMSHEFLLPANQIYMCGHSLGPMPFSAKLALNQTMQDWENMAVQSFNKSKWLEFSEQAAQSIALLLGVTPNEVTVCDSTTINLYKVILSAMKLQQPRNEILVDRDNFPADLYVTQGIKAFNENIILRRVAIGQIEDAMNKNVAVLVLSHIHYRDARQLDLQRITEKAHSFGIRVVWDLSHSIGIVPLDLRKAEIDFAVGCTYKYLNGGPGAPAFIYINKKLLTQVQSPIYGWLGHSEPFAFNLDYQSKGIAQFKTGTPSILSLSALLGALKLFERVKLNELYQKTEEYTAKLIEQLQALSLTVVTPSHQPRGGHVAFLYRHAYSLSRALIHYGVICDYREPDLIRLCVNPLYLSINEIKMAITILQGILLHETYQCSEFQHKLKVT